jgi:hypothetical protein
MLQWWTRAAEGGFAPAQFNLALAYQEGKVVARDDAKAFLWMGKAAEQGVALAQARLGTMYGLGAGTRADPQQAAAWYRKAAEQGNETAMVNLGDMYAAGEGVPKDTAQALRWLRRPVANGVPRAVALRAKICAADAAACAGDPAPEHFVFEMNEPRVRIVIPDAPPMQMGPHPRVDLRHARFLGANAAYSLSVLTPTADPGMDAAACARSMSSDIFRQFGLKREDVVARRPNERTFLLLFPVKVDPILQLKAYLLSSAEGYCVQVHLSKTVTSKDDIEPWFRGFGNARIEAP